MAPLLAVTVLLTLTAGSTALSATPGLEQGVIDAYISSRAAAAAADRASWDAQMDAAAVKAQALATQASWQAPAHETTQQQQRQQQYVDLSSGGGGISLQTAPTVLKFDPETARYPRMPNAQPSPRPMLFGSCPDSRSVKKFGVKGDSTTDDTGAIAAATERKLPFLYFPPGNYRIASSLTITKQIIMGANTWFAVDAGATLTLMARPHKWDIRSPMFTGAGKVKLAGAADTVHPDWFKSSSDTDSDALQKAVDSCTGSCTLMLTRGYTVKRALNLRPNVGVQSSNSAMLFCKPVDNTGEGVVLTSGTYNRPLRFGALVGFHSFAIKVQGGVSGAEIQVAGILKGGDGIVFAAEEGSRHTISNVFVTHISATNSVQRTVVLRGSSATQRIQNCVVRGSFVLNSGHLNPAAPSAALAIAGRQPPTIVGTSVVFQAVEAAQFAKATNFAMVRNTAAHSAVNVVFRVEAWGGGLTAAGAGKMVEGRFRRLRFLAHMSGGIPTASNFMEGLTGSPSSNMVTTWGVASACCEYIMPAVPTPASFNGGQPVLDQVFYVNAPVVSTWQPGEERTFYLYNAYAKTAGARLSCLPFRAFNAGVVCVGLENQNAVKSGQIAVRLRNTASYPLPAWQSAHRFGVQVGP